jgi:hypothetical protein
MFGYSKNLVDSESIFTQLSTECYEVTSSYDEFLSQVHKHVPKPKYNPFID